MVQVHAERPALEARTQYSRIALVGVRSSFAPNHWEGEATALNIFAMANALETNGRARNGLGKVEENMLPGVASHSHTFNGLGKFGIRLGGLLFEQQTQII